MKARRQFIKAKIERALSRQAYRKAKRYYNGTTIFEGRDPKPGEYNDYAAVVMRAIKPFLK